MPRNDDAEVKSEALSPSKFADKWARFPGTMTQFFKDIKEMHHEIINLNNTLVAKRAELQLVKAQIVEARKKAKMQYGCVDGKLVEIAGA